MSFQVHWVSEAEEELAAIWLGAGDRNAVTEAAHRIDQTLQTNPEEAGESRSEDVAMPSFYFEQVLQTALNGIDQNITGPVLRLAGVILILSLLYAVYEAYSNGGDVRALGVAGIKYLVLGLVFLNYQQAFRSVNGMFNTVADFIYNTNGIGDVI